MRKKILKNLLIISVCGIVLITVVLYAIQTIIAQGTAQGTLTLHLENIAEHIKQNDLQTEELILATKEDYFSRARALAMMIELEPEIVRNRDTLNQVATALNVDEVHITD